MGTKRPDRTIVYTVPNVSMSEHNKLQPGAKISRDPSPRPAMTAQTDRGREGTREDEWRRDRRRDKDQRYKEPIEPRRDRYYDMGRRPKTQDGERDHWKEDQNMRPLSNIEMENEKEGDRGVRKGDTFPRSARNHGPIMLAAAMEAEREVRRKKKEDRERDRVRDRVRDKPTERDHRSKCKDEGRRARDDREQDRYYGFEDRRREGNEQRDRYGTRKNEKQRADRGPREPPRMSSLERQRREVYWDKAESRDGRRDTRSEGEIDERQRRRERVRDKEEMNDHHSRSEGETRSKTERERQDYRDQERYRDKEDRYRNWEERYRDSRENERTAWDRGQERPRRSEEDRRREDRYKDRDYDKRRRKDRPREHDSQTQSRPAQRVPPRVPPQASPRAQSSGEWSSDMDGEARVRIDRDEREKLTGRETTKQRKMWLEPQRDPTRRDSALAGEDREEERITKGLCSEETPEINVDGEVEWFEEKDREESCPKDSEENTEDSEGGSDVGWTLERERIVSGEDGFVTVSSSDEEGREEDFKDCVEFWGERDTEDTMDEEEFSDELGRVTPSKSVFVIGQTLPEQLQVDGETAKNVPPEQKVVEHEYDEVREIVEMISSGDQIAMDGVDTRSNLFLDFGTIKRDSQTERLLLQWREKIQSDEESQRLSPIPINPYADVPVQMPNEQVQSTLERRNSGGMTPEEMEATRIRMSGAWSMSEETKRHSQAPHLKWAKNVVQEILGQSDENIDNPQPEEGGAVRQNLEIPTIKTEDGNLDRDLEDDEESVELEGLRDDEDGRSKSWGELDLRSVLDSIGKRKRNSKFFNAAQLYQQYSEAAQNFEILRQARSEVVSNYEGSSPASSPPPARRPLPPLPVLSPHPHSLSHHGSLTSVQSLPLPQPPRSERRASSPRLSFSLTQSASLWRELPTVRNSPELQELSEDQRKLQEVRFEVVTSEASYCRSLDIVVDHFVKSKQLGALLTTQDRNWLFSRLGDVRAISHSFLSKLEEKVESDILHFTVCDVIARHCQRFKMVYVPYLTNQSYQDATYQRLMNENQGFRRIVEKLERSPVCQRLPLRSFLVLPFQRITRIKLLVQNIVKRTMPGTAEATQAIKALKLLEKLIQEGNDSITQMKSIESLVSLSAKVDFECKTLPLISQSRRLVREGKVTELMDFALKETERNLYLHLFNDYLLLSLQKEGGRFTVIDTSPVSELRAENCRVKLHSLQKNLFRLHMSHKSLLLRTDTQSDKLRWISALSRPHSEVDFSAAQDFPQMQCIRAIVAQQPDELSLEKADIILVHQQSSDHWVEGTRLSDRHRGWIPESHLEAISNSEIRKRNLSDALKLTAATAQAQN